MISNWKCPPRFGSLSVQIKCFINFDKQPLKIIWNTLVSTLDFREAGTRNNDDEGKDDSAEKRPKIF